MSKRRRYILLVCTALSAASCGKQEAGKSQEELCPKLYVSTESTSTKVQLSDSYTTVWTAGDELSVFHKNSTNSRWRFDGNTGDRSGSLSIVSDFDGSIVQDDILAIYPYGAGTQYDIATHRILLELPGTQHYAPGSYGIGSNLMYYKGTDTSFEMKNMLSYLAIQLKGEGVVRSIQLTGNNGESLCGPASIDTTTDALIVGGGLDLSPAYKSIVLDCGEGVALSSELATTFMLALPPMSFSNGFSIEVTFADDSLLGRSSERSTTFSRNTIKLMSELDTSGAANLSSFSTANSYIVTKTGRYKIKAVQGNSNTPVGDIANVQVLWESLGTKSATNVGDLVSKVSYADGYISFTASDKKGNAVIAATDASDNILWSWHIWMTDRPKDQEYINDAGTMMDRNLGATSATPGDLGALGLLYQWGRKDPFIGADRIDGGITALSSSAKWSKKESDSFPLPMPLDPQMPMTFITKNSLNGDWYYTGTAKTDDTRWQKTKTIYDPCPVGYKVPVGGENSIWLRSLMMVSEAGVPMESFDDGRKGYNFGKDSGIRYFTNDINCWYPLAGSKSCVDNFLESIGKYGFYWSCTASGKAALGLELYDYGFISFLGATRANGQSVRCQKE